MLAPASEQKKMFFEVKLKKVSNNCIYNIHILHFITYKVFQEPYMLQLIFPTLKNIGQYNAVNL